SLALVGCTPSAPEANVDAVGVAADAIDTSVCPANVPPELTPASDQTLKSTFTGVGVQIYVCIEKQGKFSWNFVAPQANLTNDDGNVVGAHFIGPTWQASNGSAVTAGAKTAAPGNGTDIPWLLLTKMTHSGGDGRFDDVTAIQRLSTVGGVAPATG